MKEFAQSDNDLLAANLKRACMNFVTIDFEAAGAILEILSENDFIRNL